MRRSRTRRLKGADRKGRKVKVEKGEFEVKIKTAEHTKDSKRNKVKKEEQKKDEERGRE